jgi:hypothetical protein
MQGTSEGEERARADRALTKTYSFTSLDSAFWRGPVIGLSPAERPVVQPVPDDDIERVSARADK